MPGGKLKTFKKFFKIFLAEEMEDLWILIVYGICVSICSLVIPIAVQTYVNTIGFGLLLQPILILTLIVFSVLVFSGTIRALQTFMTELLQQRLFAKVAMALALKIPKVHYGYFLKQKSVDEVNYFLEIATLQKTATVLILDASAVVLQVVFGLLLLAFYHPFLLALNLLILLFIGIFFIGPAGKAIETSMEESKSKYAVANWLSEIARNSVNFRTHESREYAASRADQLTSDYLLKRKGHFKILFRQIVAAIAIQVIVSTLLLGVGGWLVVRGQLTLGQLVASELIVSSVVLGLGEIGVYLESFYDLSATLDKLGHLFDLPNERSEGEKHETQPWGSELLKVSGLNLGANPISFEMKSGERVAVVGSDDSVRSSLIQILYGLKENYTGIVEFDRVDLRYHSLENLRAKIAYVGKSVLMNGSILENLRFGDETISILEIQRILSALSIHDELSRLPQGLHTQIHGREQSLSKGIEKKILIARALLSQPRLILFDEVMDHPDLQEDPALKAFFEKTGHEFAVLVTARNLEPVKLFEMLVLQQSNKIGVVESTFDYQLDRTQADLHVIFSS